VLADVWSFVYDSPLPADWVESIVGMRRRMEKKSRFREAETIDIKVGPGGMADIEFLTQMIQLKTGGGDQLIRGKPVLEVLSRLTGRCVAADESAHLCAAYRLYREIEKLMRITLEERGSVLPEGRNLTLLARCLDRSTPAELRNRLSKEMHGIRKAFLEISQRIAMEAAPR
jgi:glutamate-ammonia-ligase adenylyltransferase